MPKDHSGNEAGSASTPNRGTSKGASATVYLVEELGDARLLCDQLLRYIERATQLVEKSGKRDHFFEVAGDLLQGIPETAFKLHKALQAVALATNRIDYEEVKQELRPEKADELERVLEDVRIRPVRRQGAPMNPSQAVQKLRALSASYKEAGSLPLGEALEFIAALEQGLDKTASEQESDPAERLAAMAYALENPPEGGAQPSRARLAAMVRHIVAETLQAEAQEEGQDKTAAVAVNKLERMVENTEKQLKEMKHSLSQYKRDPGANAPQLDNFASAVSSIMSAGRMVMRSMGKTASDDVTASAAADAKKLGGLALSAKKHIQAAVSDLKEAESLWAKKPEGVHITSKLDKGGLSKLIKTLEAATSEYLGWGGLSFSEKRASDDDKAARYEEGEPADLSKLIKTDKEAKGGMDIRELKALQKALEDIVVEAKKSKVSAVEALAQKALKNIKVASVTAAGAKASEDPWKVASDDDKKARFEEGKPADPTENMDPEDAAKWKQNTEEHKDKFKEASFDPWKVTASEEEDEGYQTRTAAKHEIPLPYDNVKSVGKRTYGKGRIEYWYTLKNGGKMVYPERSKFIYQLRNQANVREAEKLVKELDTKLPG